MYQVSIERHSVSPYGTELVSVLWTFPRIVLAEAVTHRTIQDQFGEWECSMAERSTTQDMSKNSASSRAIPTEKMLDRVMREPFVPRMTLLSPRGGMAGVDVEDRAIINEAVRAWLKFRDAAVDCSKQLHALGIAKQVANRPLEPFSWVTQLVTATRSSWNNYFALRCDEYADPHIRHLARVTYLRMRNSRPVPLTRGGWHLPFVPLEEQMSFRWDPQILRDPMEMPALIRMSAARCAWLSYESHLKEAGQEAADRTFQKLIVSRPVHASPIEHQATPKAVTDTLLDCYRSNLEGWIQARKLVPFERVDEYSPTPKEVGSWGFSNAE